MDVENFNYLETSRVTKHITSHERTEKLDFSFCLRSFGPFESCAMASNLGGRSVSDPSSMSPSLISSYSSPELLGRMGQDVASLDSRTQHLKKVDRNNWVFEETCIDADTYLRFVVFWPTRMATSFKPLKAQWKERRASGQTNLKTKINKTVQTTHSLDHIIEFAYHKN